MGKKRKLLRQILRFYPLYILRFLPTPEFVPMCQQRNMHNS